MAGGQAKPSDTYNPERGQILNMSTTKLKPEMIKVYIGDFRPSIQRPGCRTLTVKVKP